MNFDFKAMLEQAKNMKEKLESVKTELKSKTVVGESGAGMVSVTINGAHEVIKIDISNDIINPNDPKMLQDLIVAAINNANDKIAEMNKTEMGEISNMMPNIPGLNLDI